jgi:thiol-disulfide isomerase/thioredoxin
MAEMRWSSCSRRVTALLGVTPFFLLLTLAAGQDDASKGAAKPSPKGKPQTTSGDTIQTINEDYTQELLQLERRRLQRLARLAARQNGADAAATYEQLFRLAIASNLFREAEPAAKALLSTGSPSIVANGLAHLMKVIAEADRGDYEASVESLRQAIAERERTAQSGARRAALPTDEVVEICDAYYQRLLQGGQLDNARKALRILLEHAQRPVVKEFLSSRLKRLDLVGKPAPGIAGTDIDGKPFRLADARGKVVLVVFWASWCLPCAAEIESLQQVEQAHSRRGLQIVGINLDVAQAGGQKLETVLPNIRHFLLDHNVNWPTLTNGQGENDYASAYGVTEIPANVLIARDGTIAHIDLVQKNLEPVVARAVGK